jgi:hypothetical protein
MHPPMMTASPGIVSGSGFTITDIFFETLLVWISDLSHEMPG